ncbi:cytochrome c biogenesis CcdA family protein [Pseudooceanicola sp. HF7]|uniref:cytochrome c biogenesis CcdA family protein n=1 Tax=Pseudooceanicola sp. HF7 TaxID=2721560 RepID=UPI00143073C4|nr:cytochrome c biogenesis CcdA family protein [Pseudooceanicola sp. HF7]NIZ10425.1 cytochrome c biogenesis protein CcdA [Pseudooceanicola sp. HF7]
MDMLFAYLAGLLTLINPCVLPVLPIVLGSALQASPRGPLALAAGMSVSFVVLGLVVSSFGYLIGLTEEVVARIGAVLMLGFGAVLLVPRFNMAFQTATAGISAGADARISRQGAEGWQGQFLGGLLLGAVWSPCIGPTLGGAISLAASGQGLGRAALIMIFFAAGVSTLIIGIGYGARGLLTRHRAGMQRFARIARPVLGALFIAVGLAILFRLHHAAEAWALQTLPDWLVDLSVRF